MRRKMVLGAVGIVVVLVAAVGGARPGIMVVLPAAVGEARPVDSSVVLAAAGRVAGPA